MVELSRKVRIMKLSAVVRFRFASRKRLSKGVEHSGYDPNRNATDAERQLSHCREFMSVHTVKDRRSLTDETVPA